MGGEIIVKQLCGVESNGQRLAELLYLLLVAASSSANSGVLMACPTSTDVTHSSIVRLLYFRKILPSYINYYTYIRDLRTRYVNPPVNIFPVFLDGFQVDITRSISQELV